MNLFFEPFEEGNGCASSLFQSLGLSIGPMWNNDSKLWVGVSDDGRDVSDFWTDVGAWFIGVLVGSFEVQPGLPH